MSGYHTPVLLNESVTGLNIDNNPNGIYIDATMGGAGHTKEILSRLGEKGRLFAFDQDRDAIGNAPKDNRLTVIHSNFRFIENYIRYYKIKGVDGILADLGVSSHQFDTGERGFSFRFDAPLDMRMNNNQSNNAATIINGYSQEELFRVFKEWGELESAKRVADTICRQRGVKEIKTTGDLESVVSKFFNAQTRHKFLAKLFQALRIEVNSEMNSLTDFLSGCGYILKSGGRLSIITYHSLEDRQVKNYMKVGNCQGIIEKDLYGRIKTPFILINRKPILPSGEELDENTRSRSAKLRIAEKI